MSYYPSYLDDLDQAPLQRIQYLQSDVHFAIDGLGDMYEDAMRQVSNRVAQSLGTETNGTSDLFQQAVEAARIQLTQAHLAAVGQVLAAAGADVARILHSA